MRVFLHENERLGNAHRTFSFFFETIAGEWLLETYSGIEARSKA